MENKRKLRRFSPAQLDRFQKLAAARRIVEERPPDPPHIVFPKGSRLLTDVPLTHEQIDAASEMMFAELRLREATKRFHNLLGRHDVYTQFYGKGTLRVKLDDD